MSLLILNASNKIAQGFLYNAVNSQQYEKIILADPFPETSNIERLLKFKKTLPQSNIDLIKLSDRQDIHDAVKQANHLLFVAHDYHKLTMAKSNQLQATLDYVKTRNYKIAAYVEPLEHQYVIEPKSLKEVADQVRKSIPNLVGIKSDFTFGPFSTFQDILAYKLSKGHFEVEDKLKLDNATQEFVQPKDSLNPISSTDLGNLVNQVLKGEHKGKSFYVEGKQQISFKQYYIAVSQKIALPKFESKNFRFFSGILSNYIYDQAYNGFQILVNNHQVPDKVGYENLPFEPTVNFEQYFKELTPVQLEEHGPYALRQFG
ncbi:hypothetical protein pb186bvf_011015 [Paramecium bursaria]